MRRHNALLGGAEVDFQLKRRLHCRRSVNSVRFSPDGTKIATGDDANEVKLWNAMSGECLHTIESYCQSSVAFSEWDKNCEFLRANI